MKINTKQYSRSMYQILLVNNNKEMKEKAKCNF